MNYKDKIARSLAQKANTQISNISTEVDNLDATVTNANSEIDTISTQIVDINSKIDTLNTQVTNANSKTDTINTQITNTNSKIDTLNTQVINTNSKIDTINTQILNTSSSITNINNILKLQGSIRTTEATKINSLSGNYINLSGKQVSDLNYSINIFQVTPGGSYNLTGKLFSNAGIMTVCYYFADSTLTQFIGKSDVTIANTTTINININVPLTSSYIAVNNINWYPNINVSMSLEITDQLIYQTPYNNISNQIILPNGAFGSLSNFSISEYAVAPGNVYKITGMEAGNANSLAIYAYFSDSSCTKLIKAGKLSEGWSTSVDLLITVPIGANYMAVTNNNGFNQLTVCLVSPQTKLNSIDNYINLLNPLFGKKLGVCGDSTSAGNGTYANNCWPERLARRNHMKLDNQAINGAYLSQTFPSSVVTGQINSLSSDCDYIVIYAGTNDITNQVQIGDISSTDISTLNGAINKIIPALLTKSPSAKLCFITPYRRYIRNVDSSGNITFSEPWSNQTTWIDALETACNSYGIPCFNNRKSSGIHWKNDAQRALFMSNAAYPYGDNTHLTDAGLEFVSYKYERFLRSL